MTSRRKLQSALWLARAENVGTDLRAVFEEMDALSNLRDLGPNPHWHTELMRAAVAVHEAIRHLEGMFAVDGWITPDEALPTLVHRSTRTN